MGDRESPFSRAQPSRSSVRGQTVRKGLDESEVQRQSPVRQKKEAPSPRAATRRLLPPHTVLENLKQWELVESERGMRVVEKRGSPNGPRTASDPSPAAAYPRAQHMVPSAANLAKFEAKLKGLEDSAIVPAIRAPAGRQQEAALSVDSKVPISLDLILKQRRGSGATGGESTDMLQKLEQQVKAIEIGTLAARTGARHLENSSDFGPEIQLRYREHEDLLRNVTDDEAEGACQLHRGDATRNSTGNAGITAKKPTVKLSRTASDTRRGQEPPDTALRGQAVAQPRPVGRPIITKKDHRQQMQQHHQHQQNSATTARHLSNIQKSTQNEKEVDIQPARYR